jgi:uncharacterized membrane protein YsdA (DUF1294 family)
MLIDAKLFDILIFFLAINFVAFFIMFVDKNKSQRQGSERISEGVLFFLATLFGSLGIYVGMLAFHHKTKKWYFLVGIPLLIIQNLAFIYLIYLFLYKGIIFQVI